MAFLRLCLLAIYSFAVAGCSSPTTVATAEVDFKKLGTISVFPFDGYNGEQFSNEIAQQFIMSGARIVDRTRLSAVIVEQGLSVANITKGNVDFRKVGGLLGVDFVVFGSVSPIIVGSVLYPEAAKRLVKQIATK